MKTTPPGGSSSVRPLPLYILAGGHSRRFGSDKARALLDGTPLIQRVAGELRPAVGSVTVVARETGAYEDLGLVTIADVVPDRGPMGGLLTALRHDAETGRGGWLLLVACDWIGARKEWVDLLLRGRGPESDAVVFEAGGPQPLFGLYHGTILPTVERLVSDGMLEMRELLYAVLTEFISQPDNWHEVKNVNHCDDIG